jgi:hypothetical protein
VSLAGWRRREGLRQPLALDQVFGFTMEIAFSGKVLARNQKGRDCSRPFEFYWILILDFQLVPLPSAH